MQAHIDARGDGDVGEAIVLAGEDEPLRLAHKRIHSRPLVTLFGELRITRMGYGAPGHDAIHPLDAELCLPARLWSYEYQRRLVKAVVCGPFDEAIALIAEITGTTVPKRSAEQIVHEAAVDFESFYAARAADAIKPAAGEILVAAIDCKGIPMVKPDARAADRPPNQGREGQQEEDGDRRRRPQPAADRAHARAGDRQPVLNRDAGRAAQAHRAQPQARVGEPDRATRTRSSTTSRPR